MRKVTEKDIMSYQYRTIAENALINALAALEETLEVEGQPQVLKRVRLIAEGIYSAIEDIQTTSEVKSQMLMIPRD